MKYIRSADDPSSSGRNLSMWVFPVVGVYGVSGKLAIFGIFPVLAKNLDVSTPMNGQTRSASGLGDITIMARYTAWKWDGKGQTIRLAPFVAMKVPTGQTNKEDQHGRLPQTLQPGSGSWDP